MALEQIAAQRVLPVVRESDAESAARAIEALVGADVAVIELTMTTPDALEQARELAESGLCVGLGSITRRAEIESAAAAGVRFVVSHANPDGFVRDALAAGVLPIPGAFTPTEVQRAADEGASVVKLFPAGPVGPAYLRALRPVAALSFMVTGGIPAEPSAVARWVDAGATVVGIGSQTLARTGFRLRELAAG
jgi:2-dehydro-3-deoxyphosphogluconate aldolase/(4S)-4-hydroxy-2-oxoglutarate aldolase